MSTCVILSSDNLAATFCAVLPLAPSCTLPSIEVVKLLSFLANPISAGGDATAGKTGGPGGRRTRPSRPFRCVQADVGVREGQNEV